jgi:transposase
VIEDDLALIGALQQPIDRLDQQVHQRARTEPAVKVLTPLPGVGPFTALVILAETGDLSRFGSARKLAAWAGLTPTVRGSDRTVRHGHISQQGSAWLRWVLRQAAQTAKRQPDFAATYQAIAHRRGNKIATTAITRRLLTRAYHLLTDAQTTAPRAAATTPPGAPTNPERPPSPGRARLVA